MPTISKSRNQIPPKRIRQEFRNHALEPISNKSGIERIGQGVGVCLPEIEVKGYELVYNSKYIFEKFYLNYSIRSIR